MKTEDLLPHNPDAECSILGSCLVFQDYLDEFAELLKPEDFYGTKHKLIFDACNELRRENKPVDLITVVTLLDSKGKLAEVGGPDYLSRLTNEYAVTDVHYYASLVREAALRRRLIEIGNAIAKRGYRKDVTLAETLDWAQQQVLSVDNDSSKKGAVSIGDLVSDAMERYERLYANEGSIIGIPSGFRALDSATCGFQKSDFIVIAARPSMGKTALMLAMVRNAASQGHACGIFSLEMNQDQLTDRLIAAESNINLLKFRSPRSFSQEDWPLLVEAQEKIHKLPIFIDDMPALSYAELRRRARRMKKQHGIKILFTDYLQLAQGDKTGNRAEEVASISRNFKAMAKELDLPVVALSQLNRAVESRPDKRPLLSDLRESGAIEQDADLVLLIYRDEVYFKESPDKGVAEINIAKQRNGPTGLILLQYHNKTAKFFDKKDWLND